MHSCAHRNTTTPQGLVGNNSQCSTFWAATTRRMLLFGTGLQQYTNKDYVNQHGWHVQGLIHCSDLHSTRQSHASSASEFAIISVVQCEEIWERILQWSWCIEWVLDHSLHTVQCIWLETVFSVLSINRSAFWNCFGPWHSAKWRWGAIPCRSGSHDFVWPSGHQSPAEWTGRFFAEHCFFGPWQHEWFWNDAIHRSDGGPQ